ncbi:uncharacterized protein NEMAJ01_0698 [Nematocida major]|uniref:uncharacterized protein n=1 Tax=Nematocida major TaxID=1912982 RepID=UPI002007C630|nr:uncharacterized protein NEMAJ01_0698 [Nematocida major]KAH9385802.1 hypothetical protein NEMAJ01_0698 [Nematocida major]
MVRSQMDPLDKKAGCISSVLLVYDALRENLFNCMFSASSKYKRLLAAHKEHKDENTLKLLASSIRTDLYASIEATERFDFLNGIFRDMALRFLEEIAPRSMRISSGSSHDNFAFSIRKDMESCASKDDCIYTLYRMKEVQKMKTDESSLYTELLEIGSSGEEFIENGLKELDSMLERLKTRLGTKRLTMQIEEKALDMLKMETVMSEVETLSGALNRLYTKKSG